MGLDASSKVLRQVLDTLILSSPFKTCMGTILGFSVESFSNLVLTLEPVAWYGWVCLFVFALNYSSLFRGSNISERNQKLLDLIERGRREGLVSQQEARHRYRLVIERELERYDQEKISSKVVSKVEHD